MVDKKIDEKAQQLKRIYNHYLDERKETIFSTKFRVEDIFGDVISKDSNTPEQITKLNNFFSRNNVNINKNVKFIFLSLGRKKILIINRELLPIMNKCSFLNDKNLVCWWKTL